MRQTRTPGSWKHRIDPFFCIGLRLEEESVVGLFNFSESDKTARLQGMSGLYTDLLSGRKAELSEIIIPAHNYFYFRQ